MDSSPPLEAGATPLAVGALSRWHVSRLPRRTLATSLAAVAGALPVLGFSGLATYLTLLALTALIAVAIAPRTDGTEVRRLSVVSMLPAGIVVAIFLATAVSIATTAIGIEWSRWYAMLLYFLLIALPWAVSWKRAGEVHVWRGDGIAAILGVTVSFLAYVWTLLKPMYLVAATVGGGGTDFNRHVVLMKLIASEGGLDYLARDYPRGSHSLVAIVWTAAGDTSYVDAWLAVESFLWLVVVLILLALIVSAVRILRVLGASHIAVGWGAAFISAFIASGALMPLASRSSP